MKYKNYQAEDFASDESFQNYFLFDKEEERGFWENWIKENADKLIEIEEAKTLLKTLSIEISEEETQLSLLDLKTKIKKVDPIQPKSREKNYFRIIATMAALFLGLMVAVFYFNRSHTPIWTTLKTDYGKLEEVTLPDGSLVFLNSNSSVKFDKALTNSSIREVWLEGEAYFEITENPKKGKKQFIVHAGNALVEVLGTSFNVYHRKNFTEVALESGSVNFQHKSKSHENYIMKPRDVIRMTNNKIERFNEVDLALYTSWKEYKLKLKKTPMTKVINALRDNFGYEVTVKNKSILDRKLTATIPVEDVDILLEALREIYQLEIKKEGKNIYIQ